MANTTKSLSDVFNMASTENIKGVQIQFKIKEKKDDNSYTIGDDESEAVLYIDGYQKSIDIGCNYKAFFLMKKDSSTLVAGKQSLLMQIIKQDTKDLLDSRDLNVQMKGTIVQKTIALKILKILPPRPITTRQGRPTQVTNIVFGDKYFKITMGFWGSQGEQEAKKLENGEVYLVSKFKLDPYESVGNRPNNISFVAGSTTFVKAKNLAVLEEFNSITEDFYRMTLSGTLVDFDNLEMYDSCPQVISSTPCRKKIKTSADRCERLGCTWDGKEAVIKDFRMDVIIVNDDGAHSFLLFKKSLEGILNFSTDNNLETLKGKNVTIKYNPAKTEKERDIVETFVINDS